MPSLLCGNKTRPLFFGLSVPACISNCRKSCRDGEFLTAIFSLEVLWELCPGDSGGQVVRMTLQVQRLRWVGFPLCSFFQIAMGKKNTSALGCKGEVFWGSGRLQPFGTVHSFRLSSNSGLPRMPHSQFWVSRHSFCPDTASPVSAGDV